MMLTIRNAVALLLVVLALTTLGTSPAVAGSATEIDRNVATPSG